jgi:1-acyl-sn-glycerol-3-phosphate acyltransferase
MIVYLVKEDHDEFPFVGYFGRKVQAIKELRKSKRDRFEAEQSEAKSRLDATEDYDADDCIIENIKSKIGGRPNKVFDHEIRKLTIRNKSDFIEVLNHAINVGARASGGWR